MKLERGVVECGRHTKGFQLRPDGAEDGSARFSSADDHAGDEDIVASLDIGADRKIAKLTYICLEVVDLDHAYAGCFAGALDYGGVIPGWQGSDDRRFMI